MLNLFASLLSGLGAMVADMGSNACLFFWVDEPEMPENLIK